MERIIFLILFCIAFEGVMGKHIHIPHRLNWTDAQAYCRRHHIDLSFFDSQHDIDKLQKDVGGSISTGWIGLQRDPTSTPTWKWSRGGHVTYENWGSEQPNNCRGRENNGVIHSNGKWYDRNGNLFYTFYCIDVTVVEEKMSWEDALSYCRERQADLPSLTSMTDLLLTQTETYYITERLWIGLRFLSDRWMWMNGVPLEDEAWPQAGGQDHQCPIRKRCGALTMYGLWESWDCEDKLNFICV
uniref:C-type lectin domain-containing protein n=1 Tax=Stegastes partitus TaxID=144197 RepID=A0A3B5A0N6_9TELE